MPKKKLKITQHRPDQLDLDCDAVFLVLDTIEGTVKYKISLLEQCIDYLRMRESESKEESHA